MRAADLSRAGELVAARDRAARLLQRLLDEPLRLTIGSGSAASEISLSNVYLARLRDDIASALSAQQVAAEDALRALGVEP